ncbi:TonB-dependent receptor [Shewanella sp. 10N.7]|uniref:TonB-dependent receptor n=1 Tax=Shewanella sp. 10N.7 TaxID=2885093 RepID=UPI001E4140A8|nr:TonB-dependent receptor [Shewanella sp. 10N.7]MCC4834262.1 TonB-dependent receptor [Shewanella sp. 10N.7]
MKFNKSLLALAVTTGLISGQSIAAELEEKSEPEIEVISVKGNIRSSIIKSQDLKRSSDGVVDAITSEDLGKFTDENIGDAINRIPGVQIQRNNNGISGDRASIRGMGPLFVNTTVNGRSPLSHGDEGIQNIRQFNLDVIPSEIISGVVVRKTPSAETIEGGIGGSIELETLKPLENLSLFKDDRNYFGTATVSGYHDSLTEEVSPKFSGIVGFKNDADTFSAYVSAVISEADYAVDEAYTRAQERDINLDTTGDGLADTIREGVIAHDRITLNAIRGTKERQSFAGGAQWKITEDLEFSIDGYTSTYDVYSQRPTVDIFFDYSGVFGPDAISIENNFVQSVDQSKVVGGSGMRLSPFDLLFDNLSDNSTVGMNLIWGKYSDFTLEADYSYSSVDFRQDLRLGIIETGINTVLDQNQITYDGTGKVPSFTFGSDANDPSSYDSIGGFNREREGQSDKHAFKLDAKQYINENITIKGGVRYTTAEVDIREASAFTLIWDEEKFRDATFDGSLTEELFPNENIGFNQFLMADFDSQLAAYPDVFGMKADRSTFDDNLFDVVDGDMPLDRASSFVVEEDTLALYLQADIAGDMGDSNMPYTSNIGVRAVNTEHDVYGFQNVRIVNTTGGVISSEYVQATSSTSDWEYLPSANFMLAIEDNLQWRLSASKSMSQAEYSDLKPNGTIDFQDPNSVGYDPTKNPTAQIGNPNLKPYTAWSFDTTLEYYTEDNGAIYASLFYKDVSNFVLRQARSDVKIDGYDELFDVTQPVNVSNGTVHGFELGTNMPLESLIEGFGIQANYTYVDSSFDNPDNDPLLNYGFPGSSKNNFNAMAYYETDNFGARVAYVYRDDYFQALGGGFDRASQPAFTEGSGQVDINLSYKVTDNFDLILNVINATEEDSRNYIIDETNFRDFVTRSRTIVLAARAAF